MIGVLKSSVMMLRSGCSTEGALKTVTSLELEGGPDLNEYEVSEYYWGVGRKTDDERATLYIHIYIYIN
jgi:hypothetical protein